ncbi:putative lipoprotein YmbA [Paraburkholderia sp. GAS333]|uniref:PqiC family protein n=1 Tax=Paraburkholderia sp. GAS333 TaxID=3156279 RepID=UPI003D21D47C
MKSATACFVMTLVGAALGGCKSPPASFYTLDPAPSLTSSGTARPVVAVVGPVTIPETVNRPQIVTRVGDGEVAINEFARWAQPLSSDIGRVIAANLAVLLDSPQISVYDATHDPLGVWHVRIDVMRFESVPGRDVTVDVQWVVRAPGKGRAVTGRSVVHEPVAEPGFAPLIAAHDRALAAVSRDIAAAVDSAPVQ